VRAAVRDALATSIAVFARGYAKSVVTPAEFRSALEDMIRADDDGPREKVSFSYRGSLYIRLDQFHNCFASTATV